MNRQEIYKRLAQEALERYRTRFQREGQTPRALGWGCSQDQEERFQVLCEQIDFQDKTVMDIGCGFADFYGYLKNREISCRYIGVDLIPEFVSCCEKQYPEATFLQANVMLEPERLPKADIVVTTGTLNLKLHHMDNFDYTRDFLRIAFAKTREILSMDFLSTYRTNDYPEEDFVYYHDPKKLLELAFTFTDQVKLIHNYRPIPQKEGTLLLYKGELYV